MKFAVVIALTLALAMGVQSSIIPLAHHHLGLAAPVHVVSGPHLHLAHHAPGSVAVHASVLHPQVHAVHGAVALDGHHLHGLAAHGAVALDAHNLHGHAVHAHLAHGHEGHYVAKTRGAVHSAPLAGHLASAASINLAPAPGTI